MPFKKRPNPSASSLEHSPYVKEWSDDGKRPKPVGHEDLNEHWVSAGDLKIGDEIKQADGTTGVVANIITLQQTREMFNLADREVHTSSLGAQGWSVDNGPFRSQSRSGMAASLNTTGLHLKMKNRSPQASRSAETNANPPAARPSPAIRVGEGSQGAVRGRGQPPSSCWPLSADARALDGHRFPLCRPGERATRGKGAGTWMLPAANLP